MVLGEFLRFFEISFSETDEKSPPFLKMIDVRKIHFI